jgi:glutamate-1-semialdehyde 2,1-aminomutase
MSVNVEELTKEFNDLYPGGHTNLNIPWELNLHKIFVDHCEGSHIFTIDGKEYIEYSGAMGPTILGHRHPEYVQNIKDFLDKQSTTYGTNSFYTTDDIELAKAIVRNVPCAEQVKFCVTGTEAVQMAIRIARAYTGKNRILRFDSHYHGWMDNILYDIARPDYRTTDLPVAKQDIPKTNAHYSDGRSPWSREECFVIPYNDLDALEYVMEKYHDEIAICHFEGIVCNCFAIHPNQGYLERLRELCTQYNIVMSMDEIITGWRLGLSGAQGYLGVTPDICTMGKAVCGGLPFSVVAGKREILTTAFRDRVIMGAGTFNGYALGVSATLCNIRILERNDGEIYRKIADVQDHLQEGWLKLAKKYGRKLRICSVPGVFFLLFGLDGGVRPIYSKQEMAPVDLKFLDAVRSELLKEGIVTLGSLRIYMNAQHSHEDVEKTLAAADKALARLT